MFSWRHRSSEERLTMHTLAMLLKSYAPDLAYAERMIASFNQSNRDQIPLYVIVPDNELSLFSRFASPLRRGANSLSLFQQDTPRWNRTRADLITSAYSIGAFLLVQNRAMIGLRTIDSGL